VSLGIWRLAAVAVATAVLLVRLAYLTWSCPYDLAPDEAHYWDWSRHLDWSYYSKGPGVAWLIAASTAVFGNHAWAVRLPAAVCGSLTLLGLFELTYRVYRSPSLALGVVALALTVPTLAVGSILMTIDAPYVCLWTWALVVAHHICFPPPDRTRTAELALWGLLGGLVGMGILFKYTMVLFVPSLGVFLVLANWREVSSLARRAAFIRPAASLAAFGLPILLSLVPILVWNAQHDWVTFLHVGRQAGVQNSGALLWLGPLEYLGGQFAALFGFWFVFCMGAAGAALWQLSFGRNTRTQDDFELEDPLAAMPLAWRRANQLFLLSFMLPMLLVFLGFSLRTRIELNWPVTAYLSGGVLAAGWVAGNCTSSIGWWRRLSQVSLGVAAVLGLVFVVLMHHTEWLYPLFPREGESASWRTAGPRAWDPTCRLRGWQSLAQEVEAVRASLRTEGIEPVIAANGWALPGQLGFYLPDHPEVYSLALANGGRRSQYDFWRPNPVWDPSHFRGATLICVGDLGPKARAAFDRIEPARQVEYSVNGQVVAAWTITVCRGFRGFGAFEPQGY
jgi:4-amino-4-deoxy-L-arabinose transferase-like glycosyltransferase